MSTFSAWRLRTAVLACATVGALLTGTTAVATGPTAPSYRDFESQVHLLAPPHVLPAAGTTTPRPLAASQLSYGGGPTGVEINPKVYLIFWGSQWSGDSHGVVDYVTRFFQGLGTASDGWSRVTSQYCDGVPRGTVTCGSAGQHPTFTGAVLAGTWMDNSRPAPAQASSAAIAAEATAGAAHFGNTTSGSNRDAQYVVLSPSGTHPDGFPNAGWCAWHNGTSSPYGSLAFTNDPYFGDTSNCGKNWINSYLDGWGIVAGHEYSETVSDARPNSGWTDSGGQENADKCIWIRTGPGAIADYPLPTGQFAVQSTWSNKDAGCLLAVPVQPGPNPPTGLTVTGTTANSASLAWTASTSTGIAHYTVRQNGTAVATPTATSYTAGGLANGVYRFSVTATDGQGRESASSNEVTVTIGTGGCTPQQLLTNPGFESGAAAWASTANVIVKPGDLGGSAHAGLYAAWLNGVGATHTDTLSQQVAVPAGCAAQLSFYLRLTTAETTTTAAYDTVKVQVLNPSGTVLATLATYSNLDANADYALRSFSLSGYAGQTVTLAFTGVEDTSLQTSFLIDDTAVTVS